MTQIPDAEKPQTAPGSDDQQLLAQLASALQQLEACLSDELKALAHDEPESLLDAVERKRQALQAVETAASNSPLRFLITSPDADDAPSQAARERLQQLPAWSQVLEHLAACRDLNQTAGGALASARRSTDDTLRVLGCMPDHATYDNDGDTPVKSSTGGDLATA